MMSQEEVISYTGQISDNCDVISQNLIHHGYNISNMFGCRVTSKDVTCWGQSG